MSRRSSWVCDSCKGVFIRKNLSMIVSTVQYLKAGDWHDVAGGLSEVDSDETDSEKENIY
jgi:hypothetical protein